MVRRIGNYFITIGIIILSTGLLLNGCSNKSVSDKPTLNKIEEGPNVLKRIDIDENGILITASGNFKYNIYKPSDPFKIVVELTGVNQGSYTDKLIANRGNVSDITFTAKKMPEESTVMEITLTSPLPFSPTQSNNSLLIAFTQESEQAPLSEMEKKSMTEEDLLRAKTIGIRGAHIDKKDGRLKDSREKEIVLTPSNPATVINHVSFKREVEYVKVIFKGDGILSPEVMQVDNRVIIDLKSVKVLAPIPKEVPAPIESLKWSDSDGKSRVVINLSSQATFEVIAYADSMIVSLTSPQVVAEGKKALSSASIEGSEQGIKTSGEAGEGVYTGKRITLDFQNANIVPVLRLFSDISKKNIVIYPNVAGTITMKLVNVPWDQALDLITRMNQLVYVMEGNVIKIARPGDLETENKNKQVVAETSELETRLFPVNYKDITEMAAMIKGTVASTSSSSSGGTAGGGGSSAGSNASTSSVAKEGEGGILSKRGTVTVDLTAGMLIVTDVPETFPKVQKLLDMIDKPDLQVRQVLIEARIVEVDTGAQKDIGVEWTANGRSPDKSIFFGSIKDTAGTNADFTTLPLAANVPTTMAVSMPAAITPGSFGGSYGIGYLNPAGTQLLGLHLSALQVKNLAKIIANPRILTLNNKPAKLTFGKDISVPSATTTQTSMQTITAATILDVTPSIAPGGAVRLMVTITRNDLISVTGGTVQVAKTEIKTQAIVMSGETVVIGGIFKQQQNKTENSVPVLADIPILGWLFREKNSQESTSELMIFITPRVVSRLGYNDKNTVELGK